MESTYEIGDRIELKTPFCCGGVFIPTLSPFIIIDGPFIQSNGDIKWEILLHDNYSQKVSEVYFK